MMRGDDNRDKKSECLCISEMTAMKIESIYTGTKEVLTSFVGELVGPTVGLDDGCSEDREQKISCVSKCDVKVCILKKSRDRIDEQQKQLTPAVGLDVGTSVGFRGDWLGLDVGCEM